MSRVLLVPRLVGRGFGQVTDPISCPSGYTPVNPSGLQWTWGLWGYPCPPPLLRIAALRLCLWILALQRSTIHLDLVKRFKLEIPGRRDRWATRRSRHRIGQPKRCAGFNIVDGADRL